MKSAFCFAVIAAMCFLMGCACTRTRVTVTRVGGEPSISVEFYEATDRR